jgi:hypothetical protein
VVDDRFAEVSVLADEFGSGILVQLRLSSYIAALKVERFLANIS